MHWKILHPHGTRLFDIIMEFQRMRFGPVACTLLGLLLGACASGAVPGAMVPPLTAETLIGDQSSLRRSVALGAVNGGSETNPLWVSKVSDQAFATALRQSLASHALLTLGTEIFRLDATLLELSQPLAGFDMEVIAKVAYRLTRVSDSTTVFTSEIRSPFTADFSSSLYGPERLRLANEGAIRENIRQFLVALIGEETRNPAMFRGAVARTS